MCIRDRASAALVSLGRTVLGTIGAVLGAAYLGFMFTQQKMWARKFWSRFTIITMYFNAGLIPWYITMRNPHLTNNFLAYIPVSYTHLDVYKRQVLAQGSMTVLLPLLKDIPVPVLSSPRLCVERVKELLEAQG